MGHLVDLLYRELSWKKGDAFAQQRDTIGRYNDSNRSARLMQCLRKYLSRPFVYVNLQYL